LEGVVDGRHDISIRVVVFAVTRGVLSSSEMEGILGSSLRDGREILCQERRVSLEWKEGVARSLWERGGGSTSSCEPSQSTLNVVGFRGDRKLQTTTLWNRRFKRYS
jgi:hypothetical protein